MKKVNIHEIEYSEKQKELDDILYWISTARHCDWYDGLIVPALRDEECEELAKKYKEFSELLHRMYDLSLERSTWDEDSDDYVLIIDD